MNKHAGIILICLLAAGLFWGCGKELSQELAIVPKGAVATGTLKDSLGNCLPDSVYGTYYDGVLPGDTNYVQIQVNVYSLGTYNIQSNVQNGFQLTDSGSFTTLGLNTIKLKASGPALNIGSTNFTINYDAGSCIITVNVLDSTGTGLGGDSGNIDTTAAALNAWKFTANGHTYGGGINTAVFTSLGEILTLTGTMQSGATDTTFGLSVQLTSSAVDTGTFQTSLPGNDFSLQQTTGSIIFAANAITSPPVLNIVITNFIASTKVVTGTFSGNSYDINGNTVPIVAGSFKATVTIQ
jgi:hypothetical protein